MSRIVYLGLALILVLGVSLGYSRWRQEQGQPEVPAVGDNLTIDELDLDSNPSPTVTNAEPTAIISGSTGRVAIYTTTEGEVTRFQLRGELPILSEGFYAAWLENSDQADLVNLGQFRLEKGGLLLEFQTKGRVTGYDEIIITREFVDDAKPEEVIVRGKLP